MCTSKKTSIKNFYVISLVDYKVFPISAIAWHSLSQNLKFKNLVHAFHQWKNDFKRTTTSRFDLKGLCPSTSLSKVCKVTRVILQLQNTANIRRKYVYEKAAYVKLRPKLMEYYVLSHVEWITELELAYNFNIRRGHNYYNLERKEGSW